MPFSPEPGGLERLARVRPPALKPDCRTQPRFKDPAP
jgi:hypothetical protein